MKRIEIEPRKNYIDIIENLGFNFHLNYWKENSYYSFTLEEIELLEKATKECYDMYCQAAQYVIDNNLWKSISIPEELGDFIKESWDRDDLSLYGRFDFSFVEEFGRRVPKLLEFNADTPTSLLEASIIQWDWKKDLFPNNDQYNSIHEYLVQSWKDIHKKYKSDIYHFSCCRENVEDEETLQYIISTAMEAGLNTAEIDMDQLLWDENENKFVDPSGSDIKTCFKLYPWEWMISESIDACKSKINWLEPIWKSIMSNKALLKIIYDLFPFSPYILKCNDNGKGLRNYVKKPVFSREGANIEIVKNNSIVENTSGDYGEEGFIYQDLAELPCIDGNHFACIGSWVIGGEPAGIGIRETTSRITDNLSEFIPHIIE